MTHLILDIWSSEKLHLDRSFSFLRISETNKISETFEFDFENSLPEGIFGQNIRDLPNGSLTADPRSSQAATLNWWSFDSVFFLASWGSVMNFISSKKNYVIQFLINCLQEKGKN